MECESHFEELVRSGEQAVVCPECGAAKVLKQFSTFAVHGAREGQCRALRAASERRLLRRLLRLRLARSESHPATRVNCRPMDAVERAAALREYAEQTATCTKCALAAGRTQVVFGSGSPNADLMFVGEAPGFHEDQQGVPFVGQAGKLLDRLLEGIGLTRADVYVVNVLKCRPPGNRDPLPEEIAACEPHLFRQIELMEPKLVATLGNFATKLLSGRPAGITRVHGQQQEVTLGSRKVSLYPLYHPAAALYTPSMLKVLEEDFARIPELLDEAQDAPPEVETPPVAEREPEPVQLGLFCGGQTWADSSVSRHGLGGGDRGGRGTARRAAPARRRRHDLGRAREREDDLRARRLSLVGRGRARDEPDVHHRASVSRPQSTSPISTCSASAGSRRRNGVIWSRTSTTPWSSSSGRRPASPLSPRASVAVRIEHAGGDRRTIELAADEGALLEGIT